MQYVVDTLPFGGTGGSGFGRYHGKYSFDNFSHEKVVLTRSFFIDIWFRYPPWNDTKLQLIKSGLRFDYLAIVLIALGLKRKAWGFTFSSFVFCFFYLNGAIYMHYVRVEKDGLISFSYQVLGVWCVNSDVILWSSIAVFNIPKVYLFNMVHWAFWHEPY